MIISSIKRTGIPDVVSIRVNGKQEYINSESFEFYIEKGLQFTSQMEVEYLLERTNSMYMIVDNKSIVFLTKNLRKLLHNEMVQIDWENLNNNMRKDNKSFYVNISIRGIEFPIRVIAYEKKIENEILLLKVIDLSYRDIAKIQKDRTNCILCDEEMKILHISNNIVETLNLQNAKGSPLSSVGFMDLSSDGDKLIYFDNEAFKFTSNSIGNNNILIELNKPIVDTIEKKIWNEFKLWVSKDEHYTLAILDLLSLRFINMYRGVSYGNKCINDLTNILRMEDPESFVRPTGDGSILFATDRTGLEVKTLLEKLKDDINLEYDYLFDIATSNEITQVDIDSYATFKLAYQTAKTRIVWEKTTSKSLSLDVLKNIMYKFTPETKTHCTRIQNISMIIADEFNISAKEKSQLSMGALLHDIGKIFVAPDIVNKPGKLTKEEFEIMKSHTILGASVLDNSKSMEHVQMIIRHHHERYDGRGYPYSISSRDLPISVPIVTLVDSVDAMLSTRCYKEAQPISYVLKELDEHNGKQFHPHVVEAFLTSYYSGKFEGLLNIEREELATNA